MHRYKHGADWKDLDIPNLLYCLAFLNRLASLLLPCLDMLQWMGNQAVVTEKSSTIYGFIVRLSTSIKMESRFLFWPTLLKLQSLLRSFTQIKAKILGSNKAGLGHEQEVGREPLKTVIKEVTLIQSWIHNISNSAKCLILNFHTKKLICYLCFASFSLLLKWFRLRPIRKCWIYQIVFLITRFKWDENPSVLILAGSSADKHAFQQQAKKKIAQGQGNSRSEESEKKK